MTRRRVDKNDRRELLTRKIVNWYKTSARPLPWRRTRDAYEILISEVMLQQTQVSRVLVKYPLFLGRFPTLTSLARSTPGRVIRFWRGMGYNSRAVRLRLLAQTVVREFRGAIPQRVEDLRKLPGIGRYTANAVACFAYGQTVPVVDTNVARILGRLFPSSTRDIWDLAKSVLSHRFPYEWNQGLMELGATICTAARPRCSECPLRGLCPSAFRPVRRREGHRKKEAGRQGIPNRIYRGRIVEALRRNHHSASGVGSLGKQIKADYSPRDRTWLLKIIAGLERDGLIQSRKAGPNLSVRLVS